MKDISRPRLPGNKIFTKNTLLTFTSMKMVFELKKHTAILTYQPLETIKLLAFTYELSFYIIQFYSINFNKILLYMDAHNA